LRLAPHEEVQELAIDEQPIPTDLDVGEEAGIRQGTRPVHRW
jgi:hypothetical protein